MSDTVVMYTKYRDLIKDLSEELVALQRPIRILDAIKWPIEVEKSILRRELPELNYRANELKYDPFKKMQDLQQFRQKVAKELGEDDPVSIILRRNAAEYIHVISMILSRGTKDFYQYSKLLYGSPSDLMHDGETRLYQMADTLESLIGPMETSHPSSNKMYSAQECVEILGARLKGYFKDDDIHVKLADEIVSDASAGADYIKIKSGLSYSAKDLAVFEVHEGWAHLGTTLNGKEQPYAKWLSKGPPCSTVTQEGLAVLMELIYFALSKDRVQRLADRLRVCKMVEDGANLFDVVDYYKEKRDMSDRDAIKNAARVFRGSDLNGRYPFTKDISYLKGFAQLYHFLHECVRQNKTELIPFLFAGKVTLEDVPVLHALHEEGLITYPKYLPHHIADLSGLSMWMAFSDFFRLLK